MSTRRTAENNTPRSAASYRAARRPKQIALAKKQRKTAREAAQSAAVFQRAISYPQTREAARRLRQRKAA